VSQCATAGSMSAESFEINAGGASHYPEPGDPSVSARGMVTAPGERTYQVWYRNAATYCAPSPFNLTNGWRVSWTL